MSDKADHIVIAQAAPSFSTTTLPSPPAASPPAAPKAPVPKAATPAAPASGFQPVPLGQTGTQVGAQPKIREIQNRDFVDHLGLGAFADIAVMSTLALLCSVVLSGVLLMIMRKLITSKAHMRTLWEEAVKMWLDLNVRKERAEAEIEGYKSQILALEKQMRAT